MLAFLLWLAFQNPQHKLLLHQVWDVDEGLPQGSVQAIYRDNAGYLWVGTQDGLTRFDGQDFVTFGEELPCADIRAIYGDEEQTLWVGTDSCGLYRMRRGIAKRENLAARQIWDICKGRDALWVAASTDGLFRRGGGQWHDVSFPTRDGKNYAANAVWVSDDSGVWVGTNHGISMLTPGPAVPQVLEDAYVEKFTGNNREIWVATNGQGLWRYSEERWQQYEVLSNTPPKLSRLALDREGSLWAGSYDRGLYFQDGHQFRKFNIDLGLSNDTILSLLVDREGSVWIGTGTGGLNRLSQGRMKLLGHKAGLPYPNTWSVYRRKDGSVLVGGDKGSLAHFEEGFSELPQALTAPLRDLETAVLTMLEDDTDLLWLGTRTGLFCWDGKELRQYLHDQIIRAVASDGRQVYAGLAGSGLAVGGKDGFVLEPTYQKIGHPQVHTLMYEPDGTLWVGSQRGLVALKGNAWERFQTKDGLQDEFVLSLLRDSNGHLLVGTLSNLYVKRGKHFSKVKGEATHKNILALAEDHTGRLWVSTPDALLSALVPELTMASLNQLPPTWTPYTFDAFSFPLESNGGVGNPVATDPDGRLWFVTNKGALIINPRYSEIDTQPPPVLMEWIEVDGRPIEDGAILEPGFKRMEIKFNAPVLKAGTSVSFAYRLEGFDEEWVPTRERHARFTTLSKGTYKFRVKARSSEGFWSLGEATTTFQVRPWSWQTWPAYLVYLLLLVLIVHLWINIRLRSARKRRLELESLVRERTEDLAQTNEELVATQAELVKTARLAGKAEVATHVMHNVGNALNTVNTTAALMEERLVENKPMAALTRIAELLANPEHPVTQGLRETKQGQQFIEYLNRVHNIFRGQMETMGRDASALYEHLQQIRAQVQEQNKHAGSTTVLENIDLNREIAQFTENLREDLERAEIELVLDLGDLGQVKLDREALHAILGHVVTNAREAMMPDPGVLTVSTRAEEGVVHLTITDSGHGMAPEFLEHASRQGYSTKEGHSGLGLHHCANMLREMNGELSLHSEGKGTAVHIRFHSTS